MKEINENIDLIIYGKRDDKKPFKCFKKGLGGVKEILTIQYDNDTYSYKVIFENGNFNNIVNAVYVEVV